MFAKLSPPRVKALGFTHVVVPVKSIYPDYNACGFHHFDEALNFAKAWYPHGYHVYTPEGYAVAFVEGVV